MPIRAQTSVVGQGSANVIPGSTIFDEDSTSTLSRTPGSAGNRRTWTFSCWIKKTDVNNTAPIFLGGVDTNNYFKITIGSDNKFYAMYNASGAYNENFRSTQLFRDFTAWMHIVVAWDTTQAAASDRVKVYVNGTEIAGTRTNDPAQNYEGDVNNAVHHDIGRATYNAGEWFNGYISEVNHVDGKTLAPTDFAYTDPLTNTWRPKKFKPPVSLNKGITWSGQVAGTFNSGSYDATKAFDGNLTGSWSIPANNNNVTWTPTTPIVAKNSIRIKIEKNGSGGPLYQNGVDLTSSVATGWLTLPSLTLTTLLWGAGGAGNQCQLMGVQVDGEILVDAQNDASNYGTTGFYLPLDGTGFSAFQTAGNRVQDQSGNQNNFTSGGTLTYVTDSPSGVALSIDNNAGITTTGFPTHYPTLNREKRNEQGSVLTSDGNLKWYNGVAGSGWGAIFTTMGAKSGKWYYEITHKGGHPSNTQSTQFGIGQHDMSTLNDATIGGSSTQFRKGIGWIGSTGAINSSGGHDGFGTYAENDTCGCAVDIDEKKIWFHKNGTWILARGGSNPASGSLGDPANGTNPIFDPSSESSYALGVEHSGFLFPVVASQYGRIEVNFGQKTFSYAPPKGFKPWCSANLPSPVYTYPASEYFKPTYYTGTTANDIGVNCGFSPDLVMVKSRTQNYGWYWFDSVRRGADAGSDPAPGLECYYHLLSHSTDAQGTSTGNGIGMIKNGFNVDKNGQAIGEAGQGSNNMISYSWKAGGYNNTFNVDGKGYATAADVSAALLNLGCSSLTTQDITPSACSINSKAKFSIIQYTGNQDNNPSNSVPHGLGVKPGFGIIKNMDSGSTNWIVYHQQGSFYQQIMTLNTTDATSSWSDRLSISNNGMNSVRFAVNNNADVNTVGDKYISYWWASVPGLQEFTMYTGNASTDGPYCYLGFKPALVIVKNRTTGGEARNWAFTDSTRSYANLSNHTLAWNLTDAESGFGGGESMQGAYNKIDLLSDGFKIKDSGNWANENNCQYLVMAWAESAVANLYGAQSTAR
jgi:hypothetical protein